VMRCTAFPTRSLIATCKNIRASLPPCPFNDLFTATSQSRMF
jgi:hypothetical protein